MNSSMESTPVNVTQATEPSISLFDSISKFIYLGIGLLGMGGNAFVLIVIFSVPAMRNKLTNIYIINQSAVDFVVAFFLTATSFAGPHVPFSGILGHLYCKVWSSKLLLWSFLFSSTYNLVGLTVERYLEVVHPIWHKINFTHRKAYASLVAIWLIGPVYNTPATVISSVMINGTSICAVYSYFGSDLMRRAYGVFATLIQYVIPLIILIIAYGKIIIQLTSKVTKKSADDAKKEDGEQKGKEDGYSRAKRNTIKTVLLVALSFVMCWSWNQVYYLMMNLGFPNDFASPFYHFTVIMVFLNCCINPFIYSLKYEPFQQGAKQLFCKMCISNKVDADNTSSSDT